MTEAMPIPATSDLRDQLAAIGDWWAQATGYDDPLPLAAIVLDELNKLARDLAVLVADFETAMYDLMGEKHVEIDGVGVLERSRAASQERFDSEYLLDQVVQAAVVDAETGEILVPSELLAVLTAHLKAALPVTPSLGWRKTGLSEVLGDSWKDHHSRVAGRKKVRII